MPRTSRAQNQAQLAQLMDDMGVSGGIRSGSDVDRPGERPPDPLLDAASDNNRESIRICFLMYDLARLHRAAYDEFMKPMGITRAEWSMLAQLSRHDGMTQSRLAELLEVTKVAAGYVINSLESSGWVERRDDPLDKRVKRVYLVRQTRRLIQQMSELAGEFGNKILGSLTDAERASLGKMLVTVKHEIDRMQPPVPPENEP